MSTRWMRDEAGAALASVMMIAMLVSLVLVAMVRQAEGVQSDSALRADDDDLLAATEAVLDRYATKLGVTPVYPTYWVDELERARTCASTTSLSYGVEFAPGTAWPSDCSLWTYEGTVEYVAHPLFPDIEVAIEVEPPTGGGQTVTVVGRTERGHVRTLSVVLNAVSISEFVLVIDADLRFGSGAGVTGKIYSGGDLTWSSGNSVDSDYYAEGSIIGTATELNGAQGYDSSGSASYGDIREVFEAPLDFGRFWDDMQEIADLACAGGGICLDDQPSAGAYLIHPYVESGEQYLDIYWSVDQSGSVGSCSFTTDSWWERQPHHSSVNWQVWGTAVPAPANGLIWSDQHIIIGNRDAAVGRSGTAWVDESMTVYAGSVAQPKSLIINSDIEYTNPTGIEVWGLIASDNLIINPDAHNGDGDLTVHGSMLGQGYPGLRTAYECGPSGSSIRNGSFTMLGSLATGYTAWMSSSWWPRTYGYDTRLAGIQPPNFPLLSEEWEVVDWSEDFVPAWAN